MNPVDTIAHRARQENIAMSPTRPGEVDPTKGLSMDPDVFLRQQARRERILRMQDLVRPGRTRPIAVRFDRFTLERLKALAMLRRTGYQTLLKEFVVERLYEEEKREGIIDP
ncbi:MAG TPA: hypothetical protein VN772_01920 [Solirubrobacteraceae bacterium]|nr:hypothetical protein [Solirubrobacteraceae bacterium]